MSQTIYARVSDQLKAAVDDHAVRNGQTLASSVADLLDRGLQATADEHSIETLEESIRSLQGEVNTYEEREKTLSAAYRGLAQRTTLSVGSCPSCGSEVSGRDLLVDGRCPNCNANLSPLFGTGPVVEKGGLNEGDFKLLLGALGLVLAVALVTQSGGGGG
jgi:hypothetical protein